MTKKELEKKIEVLELKLKVKELELKIAQMEGGSYVTSPSPFNVPYYPPTYVGDNPFPCTATDGTVRLSDIAVTTLTDGVAGANDILQEQ